MSKKIPALPESKPFEPVHVLANELAEILAVIRPFFVWPVLVGMAITLRTVWPNNPFVIAFLVTASIILPVMMWIMDKRKYMPFFIHSVISGLIVAAMLGTIDILGYAGHRYLGLFILIFGMPLLLVTWAIRGAIAEKQLAGTSTLGHVFAAAGMPNTSLVLDEPIQPDKPAKKKAKWKFRMDESDTLEMPAVNQEEMADGRNRRPKVDRRVKGTIKMPAGGIHEDVVDAVRRVESAAALPPGTIILAPNLDHAGYSDATLSDPRTISKPVPYPGPSFSGPKASIADPLSIGVYQDSTEAEFTIPHTMLQLMGQIGSGKSLGGGWSILGEAMTRYDCVLWGADITKGFQTLGPLAPALHRIETTPKGVKMMLEDVNSLIKPRTNYLAEKGLGKWQKGCGLNYIVVWLEEIPDIIHDIGSNGKDMWIRSVKAGRSAGITIAWSLQRADFREVPTIARGQGTKMCFGVSDEGEAKFGLSTAQRSAGCTPEIWGQRQPGKCYLDAPSIPEDRIAMPLRTWFWGEDDSLIKAHAAQYPIEDRPYDDLMAKVLGNRPSRPKETFIPTVVEALEDDGLSEAERARKRIVDWLMSHKGDTLTTAEILVEVKAIGRSRRWMELLLQDLAIDQVISRVGIKGKWMVNNEVEKEELTIHS